MPNKKLFLALPGVRPANYQGLQIRSAAIALFERPAGAVHFPLPQTAKTMTAPAPFLPTMKLLQAKIASVQHPSGGRHSGVIAPKAAPTFPKSAVMAKKMAPLTAQVISPRPQTPNPLLTHQSPFIQAKNLTRPAFQGGAPPRGMAHAGLPRKEASARAQSALAPRFIIQRAFASDRGRPTGGPLPEKLEYGKSEMGTTCAIVVYDQAMATVAEQTFSSGNGAHAEEHAIGYLRNRVAAGTLVKQPDAGIQDYQVVFFVSKSPCSSNGAIPTRTDGAPGCHERLLDLRDNGITFGGITVTFYIDMAATKPYQPAIAGAKAQSRDNLGDFDDAAGGSSAFSTIR
jgi:pyrimidine deaminase RibD-like protein